MRSFRVSDPSLRHALTNGGTSVEDPPGVRTGAAGKMYLAYLRDPDGNKLCAVYRFAD